VIGKTWEKRTAETLMGIVAEMVCQYMDVVRADNSVVAKAEPQPGYEDKYAAAEEGLAAAEAPVAETSSAEQTPASEAPALALKTVSATFDGACEPYNPSSSMGLGWVIDGEAHHRYIAAASANTNNVAEYLALIEILKHAIEHEEITDLRISGDSQLVVKQLNGEYAVRSENIIDHYSSAQEMIKILYDRGCTVTITWHPREENVVADAASIAALAGNGVKPANRVKRAKPKFQRGRSLFRQQGVEYLTCKQLQERGWTPSKIEKLLGQPDVVETFKIRKRKCATYLYDAARVQTA
jgi:ribonuclease HI